MAGQLLRHPAGGLGEAGWRHRRAQATRFHFRSNGRSLNFVHGMPLAFHRTPVGALYATATATKVTAWTPEQGEVQFEDAFGRRMVWRRGEAGAVDMGGARPTVVQGVSMPVDHGMVTVKACVGSAPIV